jgi:predicted DNA-binding transcriptional regulator AlpA
MSDSTTERPSEAGLKLEELLQLLGHKEATIYQLSKENAPA